MSKDGIRLGFVTPERERFVRMLAERGVPFVIVGGEAMRAAGLDRLTRDLDIVIPRDLDVIGKIKSVALEFGYRVPRTTDALLSSRKFSAMYVRLAPRSRDTRSITHHVDVLFADSYLPDFDRALSSALEIPTGSGIRYASIPQLLAMKEKAAAATSRSPESLLKDQGDIAFLKQLWKVLREDMLSGNHPPASGGPEGE